MKLRGYMGVRLSDGRSVPQHIQQLVIRDHCKRIGAEFLLSATEYVMPGCTMILDGIELDDIDGICMYSWALMSTDAQKRQSLYNRILMAGKQLHFAAENRMISCEQGAKMVEEMVVLTND